MIIDVDIGNTRLKWRSRGEASYTAIPIAECETVVHLWRKAGVSRVVVSCVAGATVVSVFKKACSDALGFAPEFVRVDAQRAQLQLAYDDAATLGVDRWLAMLAACAARPSENCIVISAGSALTVDYVRNDGRHLGGLIVPGVQMASKSLGGGTGRIGYREADLGAVWRPGCSTQECVSHGLTAMYKGFLSQVFGGDVFGGQAYHVFFAGGDAQLLQSLSGISSNVSVRPSLVLDGVALID